MATIPTTPFDVIKTKMNTQDCVKMVTVNQESEILCSITFKDPRTDKSKRSLFRQTLSTAISHSKPNTTACGSSYCIKYPTIKDTVVRIFQEHGIKGFFKGLKMRLLIQTPSSSISWGTYEFFKRVFSSSKKIY